MKPQIIVTISREYGSAGHFIAGKLAEKMGITVYDKNFFIESNKIIGYSREIMEKYDEKPVKIFGSRQVGAHSNSIEKNVHEKVFGFIKSRADMGESFVIVGRCADELLRNNKNTVRVFIMGNHDEKLARIMDIYNVNEQKASEMIKTCDKKRRNFHNTYSSFKWGDSRGYHLCINSSLVGIDSTVDILYNYMISFLQS